MQRGRLDEQHDGQRVAIEVVLMYYSDALPPLSGAPSALPAPKSPERRKRRRALGGRGLTVTVRWLGGCELTTAVRKSSLDNLGER